MTEHPLILKGWGVRATIEGRKTQTRRVVKPQPIGADIVNYKDGYLYAAYNMGTRKTKCRYGVPGHTLYVKETWHRCPHHDDTFYRADTEMPLPRKCQAHGGWKPSIFMSREYSRLLLTVKSVRAERVQDISEEDARAEGLQDWFPATKWLRRHPGYGPYTSVERFSVAWDEINAKRGYSWESNPYVWVIEYEVAH